jgi:maleamate amidohydrolase
MADSSDKTRSLYASRGLGARVGFGSKPAILVIDFINGFTDPTSPLGGDLAAPLAATVEILVEAHIRGIPAYFTTVEYDSSLADGGYFVKKVPSLKWLVAGTRWVELDPRLPRIPGDTIIRKKYASAFFGTDLASNLAAKSVDTVIITGCTTSGCVRASAVDALQYGYRAIVPEEAVGDRAEGPHRANLFDIDSKYGDVVSLAEVLIYLRAFRQADVGR